MTLGWSVAGRLGRWAINSVVTVAVLYLLVGRRNLPWVWATVGVGTALTLGCFSPSTPTSPGSVAGRGPAGSTASAAS